MANPNPPEAAQTSASADASDPSRTAYYDLRSLIPTLAAELDFLRASLREHNLWLLRYGHSADAPPQDLVARPALAAFSGMPQQASSASAPPAPVSVSSATGSGAAAEVPPQGRPGDESTTSIPAPAYMAEPPAYSASDVPPYETGVREEVAERRDQLTEWLKEGEDVLRDYSARFVDLARELQLPAEDLLGTWQEAAPDNALPDYEVIEEREDRMVGGVGEVPPPYVRGPALGG